MRCHGITAKGTRCKFTAIEGSTTCQRHGEGVATGPKHLLNSEVHNDIVALIEAGNYRETAAQAAGISKSTFFAWMAKGREDKEAGRDSPEHELLEAVEKATSRSEALDLGLIRRAAHNGSNASNRMASRCAGASPSPVKRCIQMRSPARR